MRATAVVVSVAMLASACSLEEAVRFGFPEPVTKQGDNILNLWIGSALAALAVGAFVSGLILWAVFRYRKTTDELPRQVRYNLPIEILYTVIPFLIVAALFYYTVVSETYVNKLSDKPDVTIGVVGFKWAWQFNYVGQDIQVTGRPGEPPELVLPVGRTIRFVETSPDVIHSFYVPQFLFKRDVIPGRINQFEITIDRAGTYLGRCAEFCGQNHDRMGFQVRAIPAADYDRFIAERRTTGTDAEIPSPAPTNKAALGATSGRTARGSAA